MSARTIGAGASFEIAPATEADVRTFDSMKAAAAFNARLAKRATILADGTVVLTVKAAQPRGLFVSGIVNGKPGTSRLPRETALSMLSDISKGNEDAAVASLAKSLPARFPASGEPLAPSREDAPAVAAARDLFLSEASRRSWTFATSKRSAKRNAIL